MLTGPRAEFCARLRGAREESGLTLDQIAASTKIPVSLFKGLEGNDLSRWPKGLYRRSYLREYLRAIGLQPDTVVAEFRRLFPDPGEAGSVSRGSAGAEQLPPLSMTLADDAAGRIAGIRRRITATVIDAVIVLMSSEAVAMLTASDVSVAVACSALAYYSVTTVTFGRTLGSRWLDARTARWKRRAAGAPHRPLMDGLRDFSKGGHGFAGRDLARIAWNAVLIRIWFLR